MSSEWEKKTKVNKEGRTVNWKERETKNAETGETNVEKEYPFPKYLGFILGNEFCERYSFYGLRSILVLYLTYFIGFDEDTSTVIYHSFTTLAYLFPLLGGAIADGYLGKFKTILYLSCIYAVGVVVQAFGALPFLTPEGENFRTTSAVFTIIGLAIIAFGTGGIKPCVSSFGGDQFEADDSKNTAAFFALFYGAINAGSVMSTLLSPVLRTMQCGVLGTEDSCYFIAFALPALLMSIAIGFFLVGKSYYRMVPPSGQNIFGDVIRCIVLGAFNKVPEGVPDSYKEDDGKFHWLYGAYGKVDDWLIRDTKYLTRVVIMFLPLPIFWAGFDLRGSRWTLECVRMDGYIASWLHLLPDQTQVFNPILILFLIPVFNKGYRIVEKWTYKGFCSPLRKIGLGMLFASLAYIVSALVQGMVEVSLTKSPSYDTEMSLRVINMDVNAITGSFGVKEGLELDERLGGDFYLMPGEETIYVNENPENVEFQHNKTAEVLLPTKNKESDPESYMFKTADKTHFFEIDDGRLVWTQAIFNSINSLTFPTWSSKNSDGKSRVTLVSSNQFDVSIGFECISDTCKSSSTNYDLGVCDFDQNGNYIENEELRPDSPESDPKPFLCISGEPKNQLDQITLLPGEFAVTVTNSENNDTLSSGNFTLGSGAAHTFMFHPNVEENQQISTTQDINTNDVNMLWIFPQNVVITMAEILISITGMEFAYSQAPMSLKSVLTSFWLLTTAFGDIIVIIVAEAKIMPTQAGEYYLFSVLIFVCFIIFMLLAMYAYEYIKEDEFDGFEYPQLVTQVDTQVNEAFEKEK